MSISTESQTKQHQKAGDIKEPFDHSPDSDSRRNPKKKRSKISKPVMMLIRRIHLYSGLFMLPWVLLYGFTALLFNHPTYMTDAKTSIDYFQLDEQQIESLPKADSLANVAIEAAAKKLDLNGGELKIAEQSNAVFKRQAFGSVENDEMNTSVIVDLNSGSGYLRNRAKDDSDKSDDKKDSASKLEDGVKLKLETDPKSMLRNSLAQIVSEYDSEKLSFRSVPTIEFDAIYNGEPVRLRFAQQSQRGRGGSSANSENDYSGELTIVGSKPRDMSARSFLLRLHMAHGYPVLKNSRWFWAIAVDLMFASMVFWGLSGVFMWWQIKRTRAIGFVILALSGIVATVLAIGMHWQLVNG